MHRQLLFPVLVLASLTGSAFAADPTNPILFVTQVPMPEEVNSRDVITSYMSAVSPFSNHLGDTAHAGRGGSLMVRFGPNVNPALNHKVYDLLALADWSAIPNGQPDLTSLAVRNPAVSWNASKAVFSMVIGKPSGPADATVFQWQLYEITLPTQAQLAANVKPVLTKVTNQPPYNNVFPTYGLAGKIIFASDRPYNGQSHLTQREEYLGLPTVSGLWSLDPANAGSLVLLHHSPSGAFSPMVDSAGRLIFTNWDHLDRDPEAVTDSRNGITTPPYNETFTQTFNGSGNFPDESQAGFTQVTAMTPNTWDIFPEPRNFDRKTLIDDFGNTINGNAFNIFMPWMINLDGTGGEILNHVGRHEVAGAFTKSFLNDTNIVDFNPATAPSASNGNYAIHNFYNNFQWPHEDPLHAGVFFGSDAADLGTHGAGQIVKLNNAGTNANGAPLNPDNITVTYVTAGVTGAKPAFIPIVKPSINLPATGQTALVNPESLYRTPVPLADGGLVATYVSANQTDYNAGTIAAPQPVASFTSFRLKSLKPSGSTFINDLDLTAGFTINTSYYVGATLVSYSGPAWELDPAEVVPRTVPNTTAAAIDPIEAGVFAANGVDLPTFQNYLTAHNAALSVSRNVTKRDLHDRQQPFNLKIVWSATQTTAPAPNNTNLHNVAWVQFLQADLRRGYLLGGASPAAGRRVVATPLHDTMSENVATAGAPTGAVRLGDDGSFAAILPAGKAMTWHLLDNDAAKTSQVKERFWVTFQKGEIRTCANCHGINTSDQSGTAANPVPKPTNPPQALATLLQFWKTNHPAGAVQHAAATGSVLKNAGIATLSVTRTGGSTGPVSVNFATADGTALAGADYTATTGTLSWVDGDTALKSITIPLLNNPVISASKTLTVTLSNPTFGTLGATTVNTLTVAEKPFNAWLFTNFGANANNVTIAGDLADPDGDGLANVIEYAFGANPNAPSPASMPVVATEVVGGTTYLTITYTRDTTRADITYTPQVSSSLPNWSDLTDAAIGTNGNLETRKASVPQTGTQRFLRVKVTRN